MVARRPNTARSQRTPAPVASEESGVLEQQITPTVAEALVIPATEEDAGSEAEVDSDSYPERPYSEAISDGHREYLEGIGQKP